MYDDEFETKEKKSTVEPPRLTIPRSASSIRKTKTFPNQTLQLDS